MLFKSTAAVQFIFTTMPKIVINGFDIFSTRATRIKRLPNTIQKEVQSAMTCQDLGNLIR